MGVHPAERHSDLLHVAVRERNQRATPMRIISRRSCRVPGSEGRGAEAGPANGEQAVKQRNVNRRGLITGASAVALTSALSRQSACSVHHIRI